MIRSLMCSSSLFSPQYLMFNNFLTCWVITSYTKDITYIKAIYVLLLHSHHLLCDLQSVTLTEVGQYSIYHRLFGISTLEQNNDISMIIVSNSGFMILTYDMCVLACLSQC